MSLLAKGILKGMAVTAKNFFQSYYKKDRIPTVEYPEEKSTVNQFTRNIPFLVFDGDDPIDGMRCTACTLCEKACPPQCIYIIKDKDENGKPIKRPAVFDIDSSVCMSCQLCVEVCPFESIRMDSEFELSNENRFEGLLLNRDDLLRSNEYYHDIHPLEAQETDDRIVAKEAEAAAKKKAREEKARAAAEAKKAAAAKKAAEEAAAEEAAPATENKAEESQAPKAEATPTGTAPAAESPEEPEAKQAEAAPEKPAEDNSEKKE
ncbi:4Fe-4S dicluster domain-containing protein [Opitutia bacterium ISCC 51]|nr:4Fe-4S dicluster domain-containing protein [Opitutae bacterium ISCC 51]QXD28969.1 4Fe-4S dicluster domain-containing protein [Opitutae bacterium ISCC 52]